MAVRKRFDEAFLRRLESLHIVSRKVYEGRLRAERRTKKVGSGLEFADHRDYVPGDDPRYLDWNVFGRLDRLLVRLHEEEEDLTVFLLVDASTSMGLGPAQAKHEYALRVAAALAYLTLANLDRVAVLPFADGLGAGLPPLRGKGQIFRVFDFLEGVQAQGRTNFEAALSAFVHRHRRRGLAVVLSDFYDLTGYAAGLNYLRFHKFEPFAIHLVDQDELRPDLRGDLQVVDCETGRVHDLTITPRLLKRYEAAHADFCAEVERFCANRAVPYFRTAVQTPFDDLILRLFRAGRFLA